MTGDISTRKKGETLISGRQLHNMLGIKANCTQWFRRILKYKFIENTDYKCVTIPYKDSTAFGGIRKRMDIEMTIDMAKEVCIISRNPKSIQIGRELGINYDARVVPCKEGQTLNAIMQAFNGENMECQLYVSPYKVDLYFKDYKLAIECDENGHNDRDKEKEKEKARQLFIENKLDCNFIRYNPDGTNFSIFEVINRIFVYILKCKEKKHVR